MTEEERQKAGRTQAEYRETDEAFALVRARLINALVSSAFDAREARERFYMAVNVLDTVRLHMATIIRSATDEKTIEEFIAEIGKQQEKING